MDTWGYTFRLGSTKAWFEKDADEARNFVDRIENLVVRMSSHP
jgi:hypothetical protein